jgi:hypothetical protein
MTDRFEGLKKLPRAPALRQLALANLKLDTALSAPASAPVDVVLAELDAAGAYLDTLRLLAAALPVREGIWWACLAGEDIIPDPKASPPPLAAAQAWVLKPGDATRDKARQAAELAEPDDDTVLCATAVAMHDGKLGTGDLAGYDAPPGTAAMAVLGMNLLSLGSVEAEQFEDRKARLIDRALDIARGGNGRLADAPAGAEGDPP